MKTGDLRDSAGVDAENIEKIRLVFKRRGKSVLTPPPAFFMILDEKRTSTRNEAGAGNDATSLGRPQSFGGLPILTQRAAF